MRAIVFPAEARPASTIVAVSALALPGMNVEIDVTAATPQHCAERGGPPGRSGLSGTTQAFGPRSRQISLCSGGERD